MYQVRGVARPSHSFDLFMVPTSGFPLTKHPAIERILHEAAGRAVAALLAKALELSDPVGPSPWYRRMAAQMSTAKRAGRA